jgi:hypothetical protein
MSEELSTCPRSRAALRQVWAERLQRFAESGLTVVSFCRSEEVSAQAFYYWRQKLGTQSAGTEPGPARLLPVRLTTAAPVEVVLPGGPVLRLAPGCDLAFVRSLVAALAGEPC